MALLIGVVIVERQVFNSDREGQKTNTSRDLVYLPWGQELSAVPSPRIG